MLEFTALVGKNRLLILLSGQVTAEDARDIETTLAREVARLEPGFDVITDITRMEGLTADAHGAYQLVVEYLRRHQVRRVVRVVGRAAVAARDMEKAARRLGVSAHLAFSMAEAERLLEEERV